MLDKIKFQISKDTSWGCKVCDVCLAHSMHVYSINMQSCLLIRNAKSIKTNPKTPRSWILFNVEILNKKSVHCSKNKIKEHPFEINNSKVWWWPNGRRQYPWVVDISRSFPGKTGDN